MKKFTFYYLKLDGQQDVKTINAANQGKAIAIFKREKNVAKILNVVKERDK